MLEARGDQTVSATGNRRRVGIDAACCLFLGGTAGVPPVTTVFYYSDVFTCIACGLWSGLLIGFITEYYT
ncbi:MAG: hypothetical protein ACOVOI_11130, partial [Hyphomicrobiales bacterium]